MREDRYCILRKPDRDLLADVAARSWRLQSIMRQIDHYGEELDHSFSSNVVARPRRVHIIMGQIDRCLSASAACYIIA